MESVRQQKVAKLLQKEFAELFRAEARTMFNGAFITVTVVRVSPDLGVAKIYVSIMATKDVKAVFASIEAQQFLLRKKLGLIVGKQLRVVPELQFFIDDSLDYAQKIDELLKK